MLSDALRPNIGTIVADAVRERIVDGRLRPGDRINEVQLAASLRISRTPLREALTRLAGEGAVRVVPRSGCYVAELSAEEVSQLYPIRAILDPAALQAAGVPDAKRLRELRALNARLRGARDPKRVISLDDQFHSDLLAACPNRVLLELIDQLVWRTRRYELILMSHERASRNAADEHEAILDALENQDLTTACERLRDNMLSAMPPLLARLDGVAKR
ncbi:MAG: GntR family transcriptional regulator [Candidatus Eremiobacteraeota bacterium]|nr:GntR family transcriptional regulator [Candidatus Eremiobacteraeota bacterium]